jgi:hypothetical protein
MMKAESMSHSLTDGQDIAKTLDKVERIGDWKDLLRDFLKQTPIEIQPTVSPLMPKRITWDDVRKQGYFMNIWDLEPLLLDALELAKEKKDENRVQLLRGLVRSASWTTHGRVNPNIAKKDAEAFLTEVQEHESATKSNPFEKQTGFGFEEEAEADAWKKVMQVVGVMEYKGDRVEVPTNFVERVFVKEWKAFLALYKKDKKRTWPDRGTNVKLEPEVETAMQRIVKLREIRDQLYFQRLFPKLSEIGHSGMKPVFKAY